MMYRIASIHPRYLALALTVLWAGTASAAELEVFSVYAAGEEGYHTYRIPAIVETAQKTLLAFCEGRRDGQGDSGQIDTLVKRSKDGGATWSAFQVVAHAPGYTLGNPAPVVDRNTGTVWLLLTRNRADQHEGAILAGAAEPRTVWLTHSTDDGSTWAVPSEITATTSAPDWRWYATGPGHGIQLRSGRLLIPCNHSLGKEWDSWHSHVIYSDDAGKTWQRGGIHDGKTNESTVVELADGRLYQNMRNYRGTHRRAVAHSADGGLTWSTAKDDPALVDPVCQASSVRYSLAADGEVNRILFSNPGSIRRERMTVRLSLDEGETWPVDKVVFEGPSAYSDLVVLHDGRIGCLFEQGLENPYERITFARFALGWLTAGAEVPASAP